MDDREEFLDWVRTTLRGAEVAVQLARTFSDCTSYELELVEAEVFVDAAYTVGFEHTSASVNGVPSSYTLRATQVYRREDGEWKVAHRHGSAPPTGSL
jgi:ketosteroid isomerase-like protein